MTSRHATGAPHARPVHAARMEAGAPACSDGRRHHRRLAGLGSAALAVAGLHAGATSLGAQQIPPVSIPGPAPSPAHDVDTPWEVPRVDPSVVDGGRIPGEIWDRIPALPMTQFTPDNGAAPSERTEIRIVHDGTSVYFQARMYDRNPEGIQAPSLKKDQIPHTNDFFGILLDSFLDRETAHGFYTNPVGLRTDLLTENDAAGGGAFNYDWNALWEVEPVRNDEGWFTEVRIPFSSLRFQPVDGDVVMGLIVYRRIARKNEWSTFPAIPQRSGLSHFKPSNARPVRFRGVEEPTLLLVTPYVLGGVERTYARIGDGGDPLPPGDTGSPYRWEADDRGELDAGLDVKWGVTPNLTMDLTVNPDFAQVEADDQQVNLTRFPLFFPEKRLFFQERSSTFDFSYGANERLFYTRRVGLDGGVPVDIYGGARVAGRVGAWDVGALTVQTEEAGTLPTENHAVVRGKRRIGSQNSYAGFMLTSRLASGGRSNVAYGVDGVFRTGEVDYLTLQWAQTFDSELDDVLPEQERTLPENAFARAAFERRTDRGIFFDLDARWMGPRHLPRLGFIQRVDYLRAGNEVGWGWTPGPGASFTRQTLTLRADGLWRNDDGVLESAELGPRWSLTTPAGYRFSAQASVKREDLLRPFTLPEDARVEAGSYTFTQGRVSVGTPGGDLHGVSVDVDGGSFYDGWSVGAGVSPRMQLTSHLALSGRYQYDRVRFPDRVGPDGDEQGLDAHLVRLRLDHQISTTTSWATFVQFSDTRELVTANARLRWNPREGTDLYLVYNAGLNTDRDVLDPRAPLADPQTLLLKFSLTRGPGS